MSKYVLRFFALPCSRVTGWKAGGLSSEVRSLLLALREDLLAAKKELIDGQSSTPELQRSGEELVG